MTTSGDESLDMCDMLSYGAGLSYMASGAEPMGIESLANAELAVMERLWEAILQVVHSPRCFV